MVKKWTPLLVGVVAVAMIGLAVPSFAGYGAAKDAAKDAAKKQADKNSGNAYQQMIGEPAPSFTLQAVDGKSHSLSDFEGKTVVLHFQSCKCPWDVAYQDQLNQLAKKYGLWQHLLQ